MAVSFVCLVSNCEKDPPIFSLIEGLYIGQAHSLQECYNGLNYIKIDTSYIDTIESRRAGWDSIVFVNNKSISKFAYQKSGVYSNDAPPHFYDNFNIDKNSLTNSFWHYGGIGSNFNHSEYYFSGTKKP